MKTMYANFTKKAIASYSKNNIEKALKLHFAHPKFTERLATLLSDGVKVYSAADNPWYAEMRTLNIDEGDLKIISEFISFKEQTRKDALMAYKKSNRYVLSYSIY